MQINDLCNGKLNIFAKSNTSLPAYPHHNDALPPIGHVFTVLDKIDSTNLYAIDQLKANMAAHGHVFFAINQDAGRGQMGKRWISESGQNIILSAIIALPKEKMQFPFLFSMAMALSAFDFCTAHAGDDFSIKWPNDIYWRDRKAGGILIELVNHEGSQYAIVGVGLNLNQTKFDITDKTPVSLKQITGTDYDTEDLARFYCMFIEKSYRWWLKRGELEITAGYNEYLYKIGETVKLKKDTISFDCTILGANKWGELMVDHPIYDSFKVGEVVFLQ